MEILKSGQTKAEIRSWLPVTQLDSGTWPQITAVANHPEVGEAVALMPDAHVGYGVPIGCVMPTIGSVIPNAVGVDIGCGMSAMRVKLQVDTDSMDARFWGAFRTLVKKWIPTGFNWFNEPENELPEDELRCIDDVRPHLNRAIQQLGTLGGGNHFLEVQRDEDGWIWLMVHSGSRGIGKRIADLYHAKAVEETKRRDLDTGKDLESLSLDDFTAHDYLHDHEWAKEYARISRESMLYSMLLALAEVVDTNLDMVITSDPIIDCSHNYAEQNINGFILHRKGATMAVSDKLSIIPGSMGSNSFIVRGKDVSDSFYSCSHGAGRRMGRGQAKRELTMEDFARHLEGTFSEANAAYLDEAPDAYKDIYTVMQQQLDLIEVVEVLHPIITIKGSSKARDD